MIVCYIGKCLLYTSNTVFTGLYLQIAIKNNVDVFYFATAIPMQALFAEDGLMEKKVYLSTWKDIPSTNEIQSTVSNINMSAGRFIRC